MNQPVPPALNLLLSEQARQQWGAAISQVLAGRPHALVTIESAVALGRSDLDLAFIAIAVKFAFADLAPVLQPLQRFFTVFESFGHGVSLFVNI